jgi:hypothetical protein
MSSTRQGGTHAVQPRVDARQILAWVLVLGWALFVWGLGTDEFSASTTSRFMKPVLRWLFPHLGFYEINELIYGIRKAAHVVEYAVLAILTLRALLLHKRPSLITCAVLSLAFALTFAAADERRQSHSAARTGSGWDVLLDGAGAVSAIALIVFLRVRTPGSPDKLDA